MTPGPNSRGRSFGTAAELYDRLRPSPSDEVLAWLLPGRRSHVLDLAAGTGQVTRRLVAAGCEHVVAVEPDPLMREVLQREVPDTRVLDGMAEALPLPAARMSVVVVGSAWHWFDVRAATAEIARVLEDGGVLAVLGTTPDVAVDWVRDLHTPGDLERLRGGQQQYRDVVLDGPFGPVDHAELVERLPTTVADLVASFRTHSHYRETDRTERAEALCRVRAGLELHDPGASVVDLPVRTLCWRAVRRSR